MRKLVLAAAALAAIASSALGQKMPEELWPRFTGQVLVHERTWDGIHGGFTSQGSPMVLPLGTAINAAYSSQVDGITANLVSLLTSKGIYGIKLQLAQSIDSTTVQSTGNGVKFAFFLRNNTLHCTASTNSIFGSWADPTFDISCDLMVILTLQIGPNTAPITVVGPGNHPSTQQPISIVSVTATPIHIVAKTQNVAVGLLMALAGSSLAKEIPTSIAAPTGPFATAVAAALPFVATAAQQGFTSMQSSLEMFTGPAASVNVWLTKSNVPTTGNGVLTGKIFWPTSQGYPGYPLGPGINQAPPPYFFTNFPLVQVIMPYTTFQPKGPPVNGYVTVGSVWIQINEQAPAGTYEVDYYVTGLPYNAPLYVTIADSMEYPAWDNSGFAQTFFPVLHPKVFEPLVGRGLLRSSTRVTASLLAQSSSLLRRVRLGLALRRRAKWRRESPRTRAARARWTTSTGRGTSRRCYRPG